MRLVLTFLLLLLTIGAPPVLATTANDCMSGNVPPAYLRPGGFCSALSGGSLATPGDGSCGTTITMPTGKSLCVIPLGVVVHRGVTYNGYRYTHSNGATITILKTP